MKFDVSTQELNYQGSGSSQPFHGRTTVYRSMMMKLLIVLLALCSASAMAQSRCTETLQSGSKGECVRYLQNALGITIDGIFGQNTRQAVINFQRNRGLSADGIVGSNTWNAIYRNAGGSSSVSLKPNKCGCSYDYATGCSDGPTEGAKNLASYLRNRDPEIRKPEIYNCRTVRGGNDYSLHAEGRAVDHFVIGSRGTDTFKHLVSIACQYGIQEVIFNRRIWTQKDGERAYNGVSPHTDHVHVGLNKCGAQNLRLQ